MVYNSARALVYEKWNERIGLGEQLVLVTPAFQVAMENEDPDPIVNEGVRGIHYFIVPEGSLNVEGGLHAHFQVMNALEAEKQAKKRW